MRDYPAARCGADIKLKSKVVNAAKIGRNLPVLLIFDIWRREYKNMILDNSDIQIEHKFDLLRAIFVIKPYHFT